MRRFRFPLHNPRLQRKREAVAGVAGGVRRFKGYLRVAGISPQPRAFEGVRPASSSEVLVTLGIKGQTAAARVADLTGGWTSFLENADQAGRICGRILADINHLYVICYHPTNNGPDGRPREVRIEVQGRPHYVVRGRTRYFAAPL